MIVECPGCTTIFPVDPEKVPTGGIHARCSVCSEVFFVSVPEPDAEPVEAEAPEVSEEEVEATEDFGEEPERTFDEPEEAEPTFGEAEVTFGEAEPTIEEAEEPIQDTTDEVVEGVDEAPEGPSVSAPLFGKREPIEKAQRLARVLVSDIILYNPDRHHSATESGRVKEEFEEEIQKSWNEYVEQVGEEMANSTNFFNDALNEILAKGEDLF